MTKDELQKREIEVKKKRTKIIRFGAIIFPLLIFILLIASGMSLFSALFFAYFYGLGLAVLVWLFVVITYYV